MGKVAAGTVNIAVVGHTNTGKTSLLRTLLRDSGFGEISSRPGTTRHVEAAQILAGGEPVITLYDTPGLEDSIELLGRLDSLGGQAQGGGLDSIRRFLATPGEYPHLAQEAKVLRQLLACDLVFYLVDAREPLLGKYLDELRVLAMAARPVVPVLNFIASGRYQDAWRQQFARVGMHAVVAFDTVVYSRDGEKRLYQKIQSLLESHYDSIQRLIDERERDWQQRHRAGADHIARLLVDVGALRVRVSQSDQQQQVAALQEWVRQAESACARALLELFRFADQGLTGEQLPVTNGLWALDLFAADTLGQLGIEVGSGAAKGAAVGAGIDLMVGGASLGLAAGLGALIGASWGAARRHGGDVIARLRGYRFLCVDEPTLRALWLRQQWLLRTLDQRGHASQQALALTPGEMAPLPPAWSEWLRALRAHPAWSSGHGGLARHEAASPTDNRGRSALVSAIAEALQAA